MKQRFGHSPSIPMMARRALPTLLNGWIIIWMLAVPLFHVHPEADHHHGEDGHLHGGTVHTVWSGDLDCEFGSHEKVAHAGSGLSARTSHTGHEHPEIGFSLLSDSSDRKFSSLLVIQVASMAVAVMPLLQGRDWAKPDSPSVPTSTLFVYDLPSRAPPAFVI